MMVQTMCRFLLIHAPAGFDPTGLFLSFTNICRKGRSLDREGQRDGWGMAWLQTDETWGIQKSLRPIWEDIAQLTQAPRSCTYALHARSASLAKHRNHLAFNQPYLGCEIAFVFNGILHGVHVPHHVDGVIGAQRIWNLLQLALTTRPASTALSDTVDLLSAHSKEVTACNIGLIDRDHIYATCRYTRDPDYYQLRYFSGDGLRMVCSEPLPGYPFIDIPRDHTIKL